MTKYFHQTRIHQATSVGTPSKNGFSYSLCDINSRRTTSTLTYLSLVHIRKQVINISVVVSRASRGLAPLPASAALATSALLSTLFDTSRRLRLTVWTTGKSQLSSLHCWNILMKPCTIVLWYGYASLNWFSRMWLIHLQWWETVSCLLNVNFQIFEVDVYF